MLAVMAFVFAPGLVADDADRSSPAIGAAMLAPTTDGSLLAASKPRDVGPPVMLFATVAGGIVMMTGALRWDAVRERRVKWTPGDAFRYALSRRGPPGVTA